MRKLLLIIIAIASLASCNQRPEEKNQALKNPVKINIVRIGSDSLSIPVLCTGTLSSKTQANLGFLTGGIIRQIYVSEGAAVKKGQLLARLDMTEIDSRAKQARLALEKAKRDFSRVENLYQDTVATLEQYQDARTAFELAMTNFRIAGFSQDHSEIRAPADGKILKKLKENGEIVAPGHPVLVFASTEAEWVLRANLADRDIVRISDKDEAVVSFDAYPGREYLAEVMEIASAANPLSGTYQVEIRLKEQPQRLVTGLIGKAKIFPEKQLHILLPPEAMVDAEGKVATVFRIRKGRPMRVEVLLGDLTEKGFVVELGLQKGDTVVTDGNAGLREDEQVSIVSDKSQR
ncbi:MAG: efflux RND transporter periplasmic adaptor subunit [Bacteroidales bacterium]|nr:efflux RND transporter periplasmic adaptor subunit [Bacteroidales bacterium]